MLAAAASSSGSKPGSMNNMQMQLRKLCNHPLLLEKQLPQLPAPGGAAARRMVDEMVSGSGEMGIG